MPWQYEADMTTLFSHSRITCADEGAAQESREISTTQLAPEGAPQTEDINGPFQVTRIGTQASHVAEIREVHLQAHDEAASEAATDSQVTPQRVFIKRFSYFNTDNIINIIVVAYEFRKILRKSGPPTFCLR